MFKTNFPKLQNMPEERFAAKSFWFRLFVRLFCWFPGCTRARTLSHVPFYKNAKRWAICYVMQEDLFFKVDKKIGVWWALGTSARASRMNAKIQNILDPRHMPDIVVPINSDFAQVKFDAPKEDF